MEIKERRGKPFMITEVGYGTRHATVTVRNVAYDKGGNMFFAGPEATETGGYKYVHQFDPEKAKQLAFENAADKLLSMTAPE